MNLPTSITRNDDDHLVVRRDSLTGLFAPTETVVAPHTRWRSRDMPSLVLYASVIDEQGYVWVQRWGTPDALHKMHPSFFGDAYMPVEEVAA
jgi:hypothetical protein